MLEEKNASPLVMKGKVKHTRYSVHQIS